MIKPQTRDNFGDSHQSMTKIKQSEVKQNRVHISWESSYIPLLFYAPLCHPQQLLQISNIAIVWTERKQPNLANVQ